MTWYSRYNITSSGRELILTSSGMTYQTPGGGDVFATDVFNVIRDGTASEVSDWALGSIYKVIETTRTYTSDNSTEAQLLILFTSGTLGWDQFDYETATSDTLSTPITPTVSASGGASGDTYLNTML